MGVNALYKVLIVTFFTVGFFVGVFTYTAWDVASSLLGPRPGSDEAVMSAIERGGSWVYDLPK